MAVAAVGHQNERAAEEQDCGSDGETINGQFLEKFHTQEYETEPDAGPNLLIHIQFPLASLKYGILGEISLVLSFKVDGVSQAE